MRKKQTSRVQRSRDNARGEHPSEWYVMGESSEYLRKYHGKWRTTSRMQANPNNPRPTNIQLCEQVLAKARPWGLEAEVMWSAMNGAVEANEQGKTFEEVLEYAMGEWDL